MNNGNRWQPYPEYKDSSVEWLGEIPAHWGLKQLKFAVKMNQEVLSESTNPDYRVKYVDIGNVDSTGQIIGVQEFPFENAPSRARRKVKDGDTIISTVRTYLKAIALIDKPTANQIVSTGFAVLSPRDGIFPGFLWRLVQSEQFVSAVVAHSTGVSYPAITPNQLGCLPVWMPPLPEQRAIADFLDRETAKLDALIAKKRRLIELLGEKRAALVSQAVTKGLNPEAPMKDSGVEWLGEIPAHWPVAPVYAKYWVQLGKMLDAKRVTGDFLAPYVRNVDVQWGCINTRDLKQMDFLPSERERYRLKAGDLLVCEGGEVGRSAIWQGELDECYYQKAIHRLRPRTPDDYTRFFYYVMYMAAKRGVFIAGSNPNTIDHLTAEQLRKYRFAFPPADEQRAIVEYLDQETAKIDALIAKTQETIEKLQEYRTALISAAVTGKIDVRGIVKGRANFVTSGDPKQTNNITTRVRGA